jgi:hypothetical protein
VLIYDLRNGKQVLRNSYSNIAQLSTWQHIKFFGIKAWVEDVCKIWEVSKQLFEALRMVFAYILVVVLFPIIIPIRARVAINEARRYIATEKIGDDNGV